MASVAGRLGPGLIVALCFAVAALEGYDIQAFGVAAPQMAPSLSLGPSQLGWAGSAAMIGLVIGAVAGGWLADRYGRRPVLAAATLAFGAFSVATALSQDFESLTLARFATGLGFGGAMPNLVAIAAEISPPHRRSTTTTTMFCGLPTGGALVALLASSGGPAAEWRVIFLIGGALPLLIAPAVFFLLPETRPALAAPADRRMLHGLFGGGRAPATLLLWLIVALDLLVTYLLLNWLPSLVVAKGFTRADGAAASLWLNGFSVVGALILGRLADRMGFRGLLAAIFLALAAALYGLAAAAELTGVLVASAATGFLVIGGLYVLYALVPTYYPPQMRAAGAGMAIAVGRLGSIAGPLVAGQLRAAGFGPGEVLLAMIPAVGATAVAILALTSLCRAYAEA